jgi:hypothetical protein
MCRKGACFKVAVARELPWMPLKGGGPNIIILFMPRWLPPPHPPPLRGGVKRGGVSHGYYTLARPSCPLNKYEGLGAHKGGPHMNMGRRTSICNLPFKP